MTDLLREKLHHLSSQLADAQARLKDFEDTERRTLSVLRDRLDDKRSLEGLCSVGEHPCPVPRFLWTLMFSFSQGSKVEDLTDRLVKHERESIDALAEAAGVEAKLIAVTHEYVLPLCWNLVGRVNYPFRLQNLKTSSSVNLLELEELRVIKKE